MKHFVKWLLVFESIFSVTTASATDFSVLGTDISISGFGTADFAISDEPYNYERVVNNNGTFERHSLAGAQLDLKFTEEIGATIQGKFAPSKDSDSWAGILNWGFLSWRPYDDLLFRVGKQRVPLYLFSETMDIGATYDFAHLPVEMYTAAPNSDYLGVSFSKNWNIDLGELTLDGYIGRSDTSLRVYRRDNVEIPNQSLQYKSNYFPYTMDAVGTVLTLQRDEDKYRASFTYVLADNIKNGVGFSKTLKIAPASYFVPQDLASAFTGSAYTILPSDYVNQLTSFLFTFGSEIKLPYDFRFIGEYTYRQVMDFDSGLNNNGGYVSILKDIGGWTPYVSFAMLKSSSDVLDLYRAANKRSGIALNPLIPAEMQGVVKNIAKTINASQRVASDTLLVNDQKTIAIGASYHLTPTQKIKLEWARTYVGVSSSFVDAPSGGNITNQDIDVFSFSYNFVF